MKLSQFISCLDQLDHLSVVRPDGQPVPAHFHITEAGMTTRHFLDCGGSERTEKTVSFQLWVAGDVDHRLAPGKLKRIIDKAQPLFGGGDPDVEFEYQMESISRFGVDFDGVRFRLTPKFTNCLAPDRCGIPQEKPRIRLSDLQKDRTASCCDPSSGCCAPDGMMKEA